jgi:hypothetical protein
MAWMVLCLAVCMLGLAVSAKAQNGHIIKFDVPGAGTGAGQGTTPFYINNAGVITGWYVDASGVNHGFLRAPDGTITAPIDAPLAGNVSGAGTVLYSVNRFGVIVGSSTANDQTCQSFLLAPNGRFTIIYLPPPLASQCSWADNINDAGTIAGAYIDTNSTAHVYLRAPNGTITAPIDGPGASTGDDNGTYIPTGYGLNPWGEITGFACNDVTCNGFLRGPDGAITGFAVQVSGAAGTMPTSINPAGEIAGSYWDTSGVTHGFLRTPDGTITAPIDAPGAGNLSGQGTSVSSNNSAGVITGNYTDADGVSHGYLRTPDGRFTIFNVRGAGAAPDQGEGTFPTGNNSAGAIMGYYVDVSLASHGFLRLPMP